MRKKRVRLTETERKRIEDAVKVAEKKTSGEIVPFIVAASGDYQWVSLFWSFVFWFLATGGLYLYSKNSLFPLSLEHFLLGQMLGMLLGFGLGMIPAVQRLTTPATMRAHTVRKAVMANFVGAGLTETRDRTGVLIYLSCLERRVEIFADSGIDSKMEKGYWQSHVDEIVHGIHTGRPTDVLVAAIEKIGDELAKHFPPRADDKNELSDSVRTDPFDT